MDFVTWWFAQHYVFAAFLTPGLAFLYHIWADWSPGYGALCLSMFFIRKIMHATGHK